jgi:hypothetical protein
MNKQPQRRKGIRVYTVKDSVTGEEITRITRVPERRTQNGKWHTSTEDSYEVPVYRVFRTLERREWLGKLESRGY